MKNQNFSEYPYGQFPTKFTKTGQKQYFEQLTSEQKISALSAQDTTKDPSPQTVHNNPFDIAKLLPLLKIMSDKKSMSSADMLQLFIPLLGGGNASTNIGEIISLMNSSKPTQNDDIEEDFTPSTKRIDDYKRVE